MFGNEDLTVEVYAKRRHRDDWVVFAGFQINEDQFKKLEMICDPNILRHAAVMDRRYFQQMLFVHPGDEEMFYLMAGEFMKRIGFANDKIGLQKLEAERILFKDVK